MEWHDDVFTVPEGFDVLATTPSGPQLIASRRAVGTQFHPEATETMVRDWIEHGGAEQYRRVGGDPDQLLADDPRQHGAQPARRRGARRLVPRPHRGGAGLTSSEAPAQWGRRVWEGIHEPW